jgi:hypothetical protein
VQGSRISEPDVLDSPFAGYGADKEKSKPSFAVDSFATVVFVASGEPVETVSSTTRTCRIHKQVGGSYGSGTTQFFNLAGRDHRGYKGLFVDGLCTCMAAAWLGSSGAIQKAESIRKRKVMPRRLKHGRHDGQ